MKKLIIALLAVIACIAPVDSAARTYALLVGVSNYGGDGDNYWNTTGPKAMRDILKNQTKDISLLTSKYASADNIIEKLTAITNRAQKGDRIIFYYSGHGFPGGLACYNSTLMFSRLVEVLNNTKASEVVAFIESCHSGSAGQALEDTSDWFQGITPHEGHLYMLSCRAEEVSYCAGWLNKSFFTQALLTGYRGKADTNGDYEVTAIELFKHIHKDVVRRTNDEQHPMLIGPRDMHDIVLAKYPKPED